LFSDYAVSCKDAGRMAWVVYAVLMLLVYPVGVIALYACLLFKDRERIKKPTDVREEDVGLQSLAFLYDAYEPKYWWFEVFETARRLAMTGVLGAISPGSTLQLGAGILMTVVGLCVYCLCMPYIEIKDDILGVLTNFQIFLVMLTALVMKVSGGEGKSVGMFLIVLNVLTGVVLLGFGAMQVYSYKVDFENNETSGSGLAMGVLKGKKKKKRKSAGDVEVAGVVVEGEGGEQTSNIEQGRLPLRSIYGDAELQRKKEALGRPSFVPPPPEGPAPTSDNNVFTNGGQGAPTEIEMRSNPMHGEKVAGAVKAEKDTRHLDRMLGGGFGAKKMDEKPSDFYLKQGKEKPEGVKSNWTKLTDPDTGDPYWENRETGVTQWNDPYAKDTWQ